jgi:glycosyltransferase involved in cell wall biosynthesis
MKGKVYTIVYKWDSTSNNHAGMYYFATRLASKYSEVVILNEPSYSPDYDSFKIKFRKIIWFLKISIKLIFCSSSKTDSIFFLEYLGNGWQKNISRFVRFFNGRIKIFAITHLPIYFLNEAGYNNQELRKDCNLVDELIVLGSSLKNNLREVGVTSKIHVIHHYVDRSFYIPSVISSPVITLIAYGNMMRDFDLLYKIISTVNTLDLKIIVCLGKLTDHWGFCILKNIEVYNYLPEEILLEKIQSADINLSVMTDTIGSNTIVSSMSCGLAQICSDVGSIRDYCNDSNALFCNNVEDSFVQAIKKLTSNLELLRTMKMNSIDISNEYELSVISNKIYKLILSYK